MTLLHPQSASTHLSPPPKPRNSGPRNHLNYLASTPELPYLCSPVTLPQSERFRS
ncbi:hypothetical protein FOQG_19571 [Fusarium oxysporum f. sp. raphani 54005]|uniref:Uncharacterized protein n=1 Tax=Fusarium oxysporum f. sp. raphani 54005 TaxID=1089458 RepID=X0BYR7_FUSOX|nr:hypothetical protein FOQG_19571 [Fusarium oxysporum f. sp. raphani 54005]